MGRAAGTQHGLAAQGRLRPQGRGFKRSEGSPGAEPPGSAPERSCCPGTAMARRVGGARLLSSLLLFALLAADVAPLSWDLPEPRNRAGKIRVHPRGNLWATGKSSRTGQASAPHPTQIPFPSQPSGRSSATDTSVGAGGKPWGSSNLIDVNLRPGQVSDLAKVAQPV